MTYILEHTDKDEENIEEKLLNFLVAENDKSAGVARIERTYISIKDPASMEIIGGLWAETLFDWMYIEIVHVPSHLRRQGLGSKLLQQAEDIAIAKGCAGIWLETFEFQGPDFYIKNGYELFATQDNYPRGSKRRFFQKRIGAS